MRKHLFNNDIWPDFTRLPNHLLPAMRFHELDDEVPVEIERHPLHADRGRTTWCRPSAS